MIDAKRIVLVTGANRGIGLELVTRLASSGHIVYGTYRKSRPDLGSVAVNWVQCEVTDGDQVRRCVDEVTQTHQRLDVLINNAAIMDRAPLSSGDMQSIDACMNVNFMGPLRMTHAFLPLLRKSRDPRVINVTSQMGRFDSLIGGYAGYRLSKAALNAQTVLWANENSWATFVAVCPGWVKTDMGGTGAPGTVSDGADQILWVFEQEQLPSGSFYTNGAKGEW